MYALKIVLLFLASLLAGLMARTLDGIPSFLLNGISVMLIMIAAKRIGDRWRLTHRAKNKSEFPEGERQIRSRSFGEAELDFAGIG
jgi:hypothetical protein